MLCAALLTWGCASSGGNVSVSKRGDCELRPQDITLADGATAYRDCAVDTRAQLANAELQPDFQPPTGVTGCFSADIAYVVDAAGLVETKNAHVDHTNNQTFAESVIALLPKLRFDPAKRDGHAVRQLYLDRRSVVVAKTSTAMFAPTSTTPTSHC